MISGLVFLTKVRSDQRTSAMLAKKSISPKTGKDSTSDMPNSRHEESMMLPSENIREKNDPKFDEAKLKKAYRVAKTKAVSEERVNAPQNACALRMLRAEVLAMVSITHSKRPSGMSEGFVESNSS